MQTMLNLEFENAKMQKFIDLQNSTNNKQYTSL